MSDTPQELVDLQRWFGAVIAQPIDVESRINPIAPSGNPIEKEATQYILPRPNLKPYQRIEIYNQQYWWRLLGNLHDTFPLVTRLFGYTDFNLTLGMPLLTQFPPHSWSLAHLGEKFPQWLENYYQENDKKLVLDAARVDLAYHEGFVKEELPSLEEADLDSSLTLQPHLTLFNFPYDLLSARDRMLEEEPEYWVENEFPTIEKGDYYFAVFRNRVQNMVYESLSKDEHYFLTLIEQGYSIGETCERVHSEELPTWIQKWATRKIFSKRS